jgi:DNA-binding transcriptional LysR family regulator
MVDVGIRHLQFVIAAGKHGSLRRAAESLHIRQSTLSRTIQQLEDQLGISIFVRSASGVRPTPAGFQLLRSAERLVSDYDKLVSAAKALSNGTAGRLSLGLATSFAATMLHPVVRDYARERPDVGIHLTARTKPTLYSELNEDRLDLAIVAGDIRDENFESLSLWSERIFVALPEVHPLARRPFVHWVDIGDEVVLASRHGLGPELGEILARKVAALGHLPRLESHCIGSEALLSLVAAGKGLILQPESAIRAAHPGLVLLEVHGKAGTSWITYSACWKKQHTNPALTPFLALLRAHRSMLPSGRVRDG